MLNDFSTLAPRCTLPLVSEQDAEALKRRWREANKRVAAMWENMHVAQPVQRKKGIKR